MLQVDTYCIALYWTAESVMASLIPPSFGDLGKSARNLFDKGFGKLNSMMIIIVMN